MLPPPARQVPAAPSPPEVVPHESPPVHSLTPPEVTSTERELQLPRQDNHPPPSPASSAYSAPGKVAKNAPPQLPTSSSGVQYKAPPVSVDHLPMGCGTGSNPPYKAPPSNLGGPMVMKAPPDLQPPPPAQAVPGGKPKPPVLGGNLAQPPLKAFPQGTDVQGPFHQSLPPKAFLAGLDAQGGVSVPKPKMTPPVLEHPPAPHNSGPPKKAPPSLHAEPPPGGKKAPPPFHAKEEPPGSKKSPPSLPPGSI